MASERFDVSLKKLEEIVKRLEAGDLPLEDSLKAFEEGVKHASLCARKLNEAEEKVELLLRGKDGKLFRQAFQLDEEG
jgi:exodeoxyribonuclease VII small subunit